jgi:hypothetical protein
VPRRSGWGVDEHGNRGLTRRRLLTRVGVGAALTLGGLAVSQAPAEAWPGVGLHIGWKFCNRCFGMILPGQTYDVCPAGGHHVPQGWTFQLPYNYGPGGSGEDAHDQGNWWRCQHCAMLFWSGPSSYTAGYCPAGWQHDPIDFYDNIGVQYLLPHDINGPAGTQEWHFCSKCNSLFFNDTWRGVCPQDTRWGHAPIGDVFAIPVYTYY